MGGRIEAFETTLAVTTKIEQWTRKVRELSDVKNAAEMYLPIGQMWVKRFYKKRQSLQAYREGLLDKHRPKNAIFLAVDQQAAFGAEPETEAARKIITQKSFGAANLRQLANFIDKGESKFWTVLIAMEHSGRTTVDRWRQQKKLGLIDEKGEFLLCAQGSRDVMIHPLLLEELGISAESFNYCLLKGEKESEERGSLIVFPVTFSNIEKRLVSAMVKPEKQLDGVNLRQIMSVMPSDIFVAGADIHFCVGSLCNQLKIGFGYQPNIWLIYDLCTTRPKDFTEAKTFIRGLADYNHQIFLISAEEAGKFLQQNEITFRAKNCQSNLRPNLGNIINDLSANYLERRRALEKLTETGNGLQYT